MAWGVTVFDHDSHSVLFSERRHDVTDWLAGDGQRKAWNTVAIRPITIGNKAWIGCNAIILCVDIGEGAVVGAGSVVTRNVEPWTIVAGNPARVIRDIPEGKR
jgi:acetyltransferase-like isoleucine patch superfamily enzyme